MRRPAGLETPRSGWSRWEGALLAGLMIAAVSMDQWWIWRDAAPMPHPFDPYAYLANALRFLHRVETAGLGQAVGGLHELALQGRPPLYQLLSLPGLALFGRSADAGLLVNAAFEAALMVSTWGLARLVGGPRAGLLAALLVVSYPPIAHLAHIYRPHFALPACVATSTWLLLRLARERAPRAALLFGTSLAFGLLIHPTFALVLAAPTLVVGSHLLLSGGEPRRPADLRGTPRWLLARLRDPFVTRGLAPAALIALAPTLLWVAYAGHELFGIASHYAARPKPPMVGFPGVESAFWWYPLTAPGALSNVLAGLAAYGLVRCSLGPGAALRVLAFTLAAGLCMLTLQPARAWWYAASVLPLAAAVTAVGICRTRPPGLAGVLAVACVGVALFCGWTVRWGVPAPARPLAAALGAPLGSQTCLTPRSAAFCPAPPRIERWPARDIVAAVVESDRRCGGPGRPCNVFLALPYAPDFRFRSGWPNLSTAFFDYHAARHWPELQVGFLRDSLRRCDVAAVLASDYVLWLEPSSERRSGCFDTWTRFFDSPPRAFARAHEDLASFPLPRGRRARLVVRSAPLDAAERRASIAKLRALATP